MATKKPKPLTCDCPIRQAMEAWAYFGARWWHQGLLVLGIGFGIGVALVVLFNLGRG